MKPTNIARYLKSLPKSLIYYWAIARFIAPFFVFTYPLFTTILVDLLDRCDSLLAYNAGWTWKKYLLYDKLFDWWWYVFIVLYAYDTYIFSVILVLFIYRSIGQIFAILTGNSKVLIFFPNILELYFWVYIFLSCLSPKYELVVFGNYNFLVIVVCTILAVIREYYVHINSKSLENFSFGTSWIKND